MDRISFAKGLMVGMSIVVFISICMLLVSRGIEARKEEKHIRGMINRNCNDCHMGKSFVKLFDKEYLKSEKNSDNSVIIDTILNNARLKTY